MRRFFTRVFIIVVFLGIVGGLGYLTRDRWMPKSTQDEPSTHAEKREKKEEAHEMTTLHLSDQAFATLGIQTTVIRRKDYQKSMTVPGTVIDLPGHSDHGIPVPVSGVVSKLHVALGEMVRPGDPLVTIRIISDAVQTSQAGLFQAVQSRDYVRAELARLSRPELTGTIPESRLLELRNQERMHQGTIDALRHDLLSRGLSPEQVGKIEKGMFAKELLVTVPTFYDPDSTKPTTEGSPPVLEVQAIQAMLGQQVLAGQLLVSVSNHQKLLVEGRAYRSEVPAVESAAKAGKIVRIEFGPKEIISSAVRSIGNTMDPDSRTVAFYLPIPNTPTVLTSNGRQTLSWQHWPGQRVRVEIPVETLHDVITLPIEAVVREAGEAYVFRQNDTLYDRKPVRVLYESRNEVVIAPSSDLPGGVYVATKGAAALNRVLKAQTSKGSGGGHWHADGTYHATGD